MDRLARSLEKATPRTARDVLTALSPQDQIQLIVHSVFQYFARRKQPDRQLRLGMYGRHPTEPNRLQRIYAWDGETRDCFSDRVLDIVRLDDPNGIRSQLVRCFHSQGNIIILESCPEAAARGEFEFFPGQSEYLKSMVVFKHVLGRGRGDVLMLTLDSAHERLFRLIDEEEIRVLLLEMLKRIEYEMSVLEIENLLQKAR
jgi:hypothetical protein